MKFGVVFLLLLLGTAAAGLAQRPSTGRGERDEATARNRRLVALAGAAIYLVLVAVAVTVLDVRRFLIEHYLVGLLLVPPVILKLGSTCYRFLRYYMGDVAFRLAGAPPLLLRFVVAPVLVLSTVAVLVTGLELWLFGLRFGSAWISLHTISAVVMVIAVGAHLVAHTRLSIDVAVEEARAERARILSARAIVVASLLSGAALAVASLLYVSPFTLSIGGG